MKRLAVVLLAGLSLAVAQADVFISEFMPENARILIDEDGEFSDWLEIHNSGPAAVNLDSYFLTDDSGELMKWAFPSVLLPPGGYLVVFASGKNRTSDPAHLHTNFRLDAEGGFLALVASDGETILSAFNPYPRIKEDVAFGLAQNRITTSLLANSVPQILVPTNAAELPTNWNQNIPGMPGPNWFNGSAPLAIGFDTNQPSPAPSNLAPGGTAAQSTTFGTNTANRAIDNNLANQTQTLSTDTDPFWEVTLATEAAIQRIVLRNRTSCCGSRLRDITVEILAVDGETTNFVSALLNPANAGFTYPNGPAFLEVNLVTLTGGPVYGKIVRVHRAPDPDLLGTGGQGGAEEISVLSLAEVEVTGIAATGLPEVNLARTGSPAPTASQSSTLSSYIPSLAIDGNLANFTHTGSTDSNASWVLNLGRRALINAITLHNRDDCCGSRLRDITVQILAPDSNTVLYTSALLNPENTGYSYPAGPDHIDIVITNGVAGQFVRVRRTADPDLSGTGGQAANANDERNALSLGEVIVLGADLNGYRPFIRTDLQNRMLGQNSSAFVRVPLTVVDPASFDSLALRVRYDDGFIAYLNGVKVAERNAPVMPGWNSAATADRDVAQGLVAETIDLTPMLPLLVPGTNLLALHGLNSSVSDGNFLLQPELLATYVLITSNVFFANATPGAANESEFYFDEVADTHFSVDRGFFEAPFSLSITSATPGTVIYYSFNCDEPGPGKGNLYTGPITITNTTVVRARGFKEGWKPTDVDTVTYLFLGDVIYQAKDWPATGPPQYFPATWGRNTVDYGMDPTVVNAYTLAEWKEALTQIPTMSVVTEMPNLFDATTGIYANADGHGEVWERPASLELIDPTNGVPGRFQENCGLRIRGGASRGTGFRKHSLRVFFRREYGAGKLNYPLFENEGAQEFESFDLRTSQNYSWPRETDRNNGRQETMVREVFCRETLGAMGQPYRRSRFYHLYLNGQYWGLYETDERPEASYGQTYFGGSKTNYDVVKCGNRSTQPNFITEATDGNLIAFSNLWTMCRALATNAANSNYFRILGRNPDGTRNHSLPIMLDVDNLIDYMLGIFYTGDGDATLSSFLGNNRPNNWFGMRDRTNPEMGFRFFNSDCEHTLGAPRSEVDRTGPFRDVSGSNIGNFTYANPQYFHEDLMWNAEYRMKFADHVQRHFFNGGAVTPEAGTNRFLRKAMQITKAIRAYSARWGDAVVDNPPYGENDWTNMITFIVTNWFPPRTALVLQQLKIDGLYPSNSAPGFSQMGGNVPAGYNLQMTNSNAGGIIYFTTDGSDPRAIGGAVSSTAQSYSTPLVINAPTLVRARVLIGTNWSALVEAVFSPPQDLSKLLVTEIMYNPPTVGGIDGDEFEFLELKNTGSNTLNLSGLRFSAGITFAFPGGTFLGPGQFFVLARNPAQFSAKYPGVAINGIYSGRLDNAGETLTLSHGSGSQVLSVAYDDDVPWPLAPDNFGFSLVPRNPNANPDPDNPGNWRASSNVGGSPGADDPESNLPPIRISEAFTAAIDPESDAIELFNPTAGNVIIGGWFLTDDKDVPRKFRIPAGTMIPAGGYLVFDETEFNATPGTNSFSLRVEGEQVYLFSGDANTNLTGYSHGFTFDGSDLGVTFGRYVTSTGEEHFPTQSAASLGTNNSGPHIGPVVINEILYHPDANDHEFIELLNITSQPVELFDLNRPTNTWRLNGLGYRFPTNVTLAANEYLLLVSTNPAVFRARYSVPTNVVILGPYAGLLQDSGERLVLQKPFTQTNDVFFITVDEVRYNDKAPWPPAADGSGPSLQRRNAAAYGNDPINWLAALPTPGRPLPGGLPPVITTHPTNLTVVAYQDVVFGAAASGTGPLYFQWRFGGDPILNATNATLQLTNVQPSQGGNYTVLVFNESGSIESTPATLTVLIPATITMQPQSRSVLLGANVTFTVSATSSTPMTFQWRLNGTNLPGATNTSYTILNAQTNQAGIYTVVITDGVGPVTSAPATLTVLLVPTIVMQPKTQTVLAGDSVSFSVLVSGTPPFGYRWRREGLPLMPFPGSPMVTITNVPLSYHSNRISVVITNAANSTGIISSNAFLFVLADTDGDRIPDDWEIAHGLNYTNAMDGTNDFDGDKMINRHEYIAGTDPWDPESYLKVDQLEYPVTSNRHAVLRFAAISNKTYTIEFTESLASGLWSKLADISARTTNHIESVIDSSEGHGRRFYRLVTPQQE